MTLTATPVPVPLRLDDHGVARVGATRVTLDIVVKAFRGGQSPREIVDDYPVLDLADVYAVVAYYLLHTDQVDAYVAEQDREATRVRADMQALFPSDGFRARRLARLGA